MSIAIVGSRSYNNYEEFKELIFSYISIDILKQKGIVSGGAMGVDNMAERLSVEFSIPIKVYKADWRNLGKRAGYVRNEYIVNDSELVLAFWDFASKGTKHTIDLAFTKSIPCKTFDVRHSIKTLELI